MLAQSSESSASEKEALKHGVSRAHQTNIMHRQSDGDESV